jgi:MinD-like ATPase involved in chromosome partitioning or flagellar assembly
LGKTIFFVGGGKGGVGKSIVAMAVLDWLQEQGEKVLLVEADDSNPDVWKCYKDEVETEVLNLDEADGWIELVNICEKQSDRIVVINTPARNSAAISQFGATLNGTLAELNRKLVTLWVINRQRDSLELLKEFLEALPNATVHVIRNLYHGSEEKFELYNRSKIRTALEQRGGKSLNFPDVADRVSDNLKNDRLSISKAAASLPLGSRAELLRWRGEYKKVIGELTL